MPTALLPLPTSATTATEALVGEATYDEGELVAGLAWALGPWRSVRVTLPLYAIVAGLWVFFERESERLALIVSVSIALVLLVVMYSATFGLRRLIRRHIKGSPSLFAPHRFSVSDAGIEIDVLLPTREVTQASFGWSEFTRTRETQDGVWLRTRSNGAVLLPRRAFGDRFGIVREIIGRCMSQPKALTVHTSLPPTDGAIAANFALTQSEFLEAIYLRGATNRRSANRRVSRWVFWSIVVGTYLFFGSSWVYYAIREARYDQALLAAPVPILLLLIWFNRPRLAQALVRWQLRGIEGIWDQQTVLLTDKEIASHSTSAASRFAWASAVGSCATDKLLVIDLGAGMIVLPARGFANADDFRRAVDLVHRQAGRCVCGYELRGSRSEACPECGVPVFTSASSPTQA